ncbi:MAG TPA: hypothetical protein VFN65_13010, partial [Solirubrobacteraceae bacterium]|nr:hypothetical protein [Solirubrobacteraceae bacterium]
QLIHALVNGSYTWLAIVLVIGSMISLGYYLRVIATIWMRVESPSPGPGMIGRLMPFSGGLPSLGGGAPQEGEEPAVAGGGGASAAVSGSARGIPALEVTFVAVVFAAATIGFGIFPSVVFHLADHAGQAFSGLF